MTDQVGSRCCIVTAFKQRLPRAPTERTKLTSTVATFLSLFPPILMILCAGGRWASFSCNLENAECQVQENQGTLHVKFMALVARDILPAIPGVSILVERLFSNMKHTLSDARLSKTAETVSMDVVCKEWVKSDLGEGVNYTESKS